MTIRLLISFLFVGIASQAYADKTWLDNLSVKSASYYYDGSNDVVEIVWNETIDTGSGCATADSENKASYWRSGVIEHAKLLYASILTAQTSNKKIALLIDDSVCDPNYGIKFSGIKIFTRDPDLSQN